MPGYNHLDSRSTYYLKCDGIGFCSHASARFDGGLLFCPFPLQTELRISPASSPFHRMPSLSPALGISHLDTSLNDVARIGNELEAGELRNEDVEAAAEDALVKADIEHLAGHTQVEAAVEETVKPTETSQAGTQGTPDHPVPRLGTSGQRPASHSGLTRVHRRPHRAPNQASRALPYDRLASHSSPTSTCRPSNALPRPRNLQANPRPVASRHRPSHRCPDPAPNDRAQVRARRRASVV